jgi:dipeptidyl aminopeptidase/acylaminoacyl peptidase
MRRRLHLTALVVLVAIQAIQLGCMDHDLAHPRSTPAGVTEASQQAVRGQLLLRIEWAWPARAEHLPTVLVHPEAGHTSRDMRGVLRDLASHGYVAAAVDYLRAIDGRWRSTLFTWRDPADVRAAFDLVAADPRVDPDRIGLLGFSQGGVYSLLIAAETGGSGPVVAYYPITDFKTWLEGSERKPRERWVFRLIRRHFYEESGARSYEELDTMLEHASPLLQADRIHAPVLLVHGDHDRSANVEESRRLEARLRELGRPVELLVVPDAGHVFNFRDRDQAELAWRATIEWLDRHLKR